MAQYDYPNLLKAATANGSGTVLPINRRSTETNGNSTLYVFGTFNSATVTVQASIDNSTWLDVGAYTVATLVNTTIKAKYFRAVVSSAGASTSVSAHIH